MSNESVNVRFRVTAAMSRAPSGRRMVLSSGDWTERFREAFAELPVEVPDRLGAGGARRFVLSPRGPSDLTLGGIVKSDPKLIALAEHSRKAPNAGPWLAELEALVGPGILVDACRRAFEAASPGSAPAPAAPAAAPASADPVEALFAKAEVATTTSTNAVDAFVRAMRPEGGKAPAATGAQVSRVVRDALEQSIYATARDVLSSPVVARMEGAWRAAKWVMDHTPASGGVRVEILDVLPENALEALASIQPEGDFEEPDLLVITDPLPDEASLAGVAQLAERVMAPCVVAMPRPLAGLEPDPLIEALAPSESEDGKRRAALRADESSRWLTVVYNDVLVFHEGTGVHERSVLASPAWAMTALLGASYSATGSFARITGAPGQLRAPGTRTITQGKDAGVAVPTRHFTSVRAQTELAERGVIGLGSPRNSDKIVLAGAPTHRSSKDAVPLPAQIWTGRIVRFASWARLQLPAGASSEDAAAIFEQAGSVFLFPGTGRAARVTAEIDAERRLHVAARMDGSLASVPLQIEFALQLK